VSHLECMRRPQKYLLPKQKGRLDKQISAHMQISAYFSEWFTSAEFIWSLRYAGEGERGPQNRNGKFINIGNQRDYMNRFTTIYIKVHRWEHCLKWKNVFFRSSKDFQKKISRIRKVKSLLQVVSKSLAMYLNSVHTRSIDMDKNSRTRNS